MGLSRSVAVAPASDACLALYQPGIGNKNRPLLDHYSDPEVSWGHRSAISTRKGGGYYGYKVHAAVCTRTGLPVAWRVDTASTSEHEHVGQLLDSGLDRGFTPAT